MTKKCDTLDYGDFQFTRDDERIGIRDLSTGEDVLMELTEARALHSWLGYALYRTAPEPEKTPLTNDQLAELIPHIERLRSLLGIHPERAQLCHDGHEPIVHFSECPLCSDRAAAEPLSSLSDMWWNDPSIPECDRLLLQLNWIASRHEQMAQDSDYRALVPKLNTYAYKRHAQDWGAASKSGAARSCVAGRSYCSGPDIEPIEIMQCIECEKLVHPERFPVETSTSSSAETVIAEWKVGDSES